MSCEDLTEEYYQCCDVCPPDFKSKPRGLSRPIVAPHLKDKSLHVKWADYEMLPMVAYPPGGALVGGDPDLRITAEEWARRAKGSKCYQCLSEVDIRRAAKLRVDWKFWVGCGLAGLGVTALLVSRK